MKRGIWLAAVVVAAQASWGWAETPPPLSAPGRAAAEPADSARTAILVDPTAAPVSTPERAARVAPMGPYHAMLAEVLAEAPLGARAAYSAVGYRTIWGRAAAGAGAPEGMGAPTDWSRAETLLATFDASGGHALPVSRYQADALRAQLAALRALLARPAADEPAEAWDGPPAISLDPVALRAAAELERDLSLMAALYAGDLSSGALEPSKALSNVFLAPPRPDTAVVLARLQSATEIAPALTAFEPSSSDYRNLKAQYAALTRLAATGGFGPLYAHKRAIEQGASGPEVVSARARLTALGYLPAGASGAVFGAEMDAAVRQFQADSGILVDGEIGRVTAGQMNRTAADRARQIAVNLERSRWHNFDLGARHVRVNIPDFHVDVIENGRSIYRSRTVVGKPRHATPEFSDRMTHVVVNPKWHVPRSIATKELLPQIQANPDIIYQRNMRLLEAGGITVDPWSVDWGRVTRANFPFRIQQMPGRGNALGEVKFIFPNRHAIYLHDTPAKKLFAKPLRAYSHGCVRVAKPVELAEVLLTPQQGADAAAYYRRLRARGGERYVRLDAEVPVHLLYRTAWVDESGRAQSRRDIYGRDRRLATAMERAGIALP